MTFLDLFSDKAELYASARPRYPDELFQFIASAAPSAECAWFSVSPQFDAVFKRVILDVIAQDWAPQNTILWRGYQDVAMPFAPIQAPEFSIKASWSLYQLLAYVHTWSATRHCMERIGTGFFDHAESELGHYWGASESSREVVMPIHFQAGRLTDAAI